jgi:hypothetical protein
MNSHPDNAVLANNRSIRLWFRPINPNNYGLSLIRCRHDCLERIAPAVHHGSTILTGHTFLRQDNDGVGIPERTFGDIMIKCETANADAIQAWCQALNQLTVDLESQDLRAIGLETLWPHQLAMELKVDWLGYPMSQPATGSVLILGANDRSLKRFDGIPLSTPAVSLLDRLKADMTREYGLRF